MQNKKTTSKAGSKQEVETILKIEIQMDQVIGVFNHIKSDLRKLDFSFLNLRVIKVNSKEFKTLVNGLDLHPFAPIPWLPRMHEFYDNLDQIGCSDFMYALVPINTNLKVDDHTFIELEKILLLLFPSDFHLHSTIIYVKSEINKAPIASFPEDYDRPSLLTHRRLSNIEKKFIGFDFVNTRSLEFDDNEVASINNFLRIAFVRIPKLTYLSVGFECFKGSFELNDFSMSYVCLCMAVETLIDSRHEVTHRLKRTCAVLNANTKDEGVVIENNLKHIYNFRSEIVHGEKIERKKLLNFYFPMQALVARTLIEAISLNIDTKKKLNEIVTRYGYGDKSKITSDYQYQDINKSIIKTIQREL